MRELVRPFESATMDALGRAAARFHEERGLDADVYEGESEFLVIVDAPGAEPADVQVRHVDGRVEVRVDRFRPTREDFELRYPGRGQSLSGRAELQEGARVDADEATADLGEDGTLEVRLPKLDDGDD